MSSLLSKFSYKQVNSLVTLLSCVYDIKLRTTHHKCAKLIMYYIKRVQYYFKVSKVLTMTLYLTYPGNKEICIQQKKPNYCVYYIKKKNKHQAYSVLVCRVSLM